MPPFQIEIKRGDTVLRLQCSYTEPDPEDESFSKTDGEDSARQGNFRLFN